MRRVRRERGDWWQQNLRKGPAQHLREAFPGLHSAMHLESYFGALAFADVTLRSARRHR